MPYRIILLSGQVCAGKSTLARLLAERFRAIHLRTGECLQLMMPDVPKERRALQEAGEKLDRETGGRWILDAVRKSTDEAADDAVVVLDSVRIGAQIEAVKSGYGNRVFHVHLDAPIEELSRRYDERGSTGLRELKSYQEVLANETEQHVNDLGDFADVRIATERCRPVDILLRVAANCGLFGKHFERVVDVIIGGQWGSEGKGQVAAYLSPEYDVLVRVGGPNAGHKVFMEPKPYTFHLLPSGTGQNPDAELILASGAVLHKDTLLREIADFEVDAKRLTIDPQAMVIDQSDIDTERSNGYLEAFGSTTQGVGAATARRIRDRNVPHDKMTLARNIPEFKPYLRPARDVLDEHFRRGHRVQLEGTQGTALSLFHGEYPYVTSRDTTVAGCLADAGISPSRVRKVVMVCRTYPIRVGGNSGPMGLETTWATVAKRSGVPLDELVKVEKTSTTHRDRRVAEFNWELLRFAASLNAPTDVALTFADYLAVTNRSAKRVEQLSPETIRFIEEVERVATAPVSLISTRFHSLGIIDRRRW
jgi:adenylosuccinate synthase